MTLNITKMPFSRFGSYLTVSHLSGKSDLADGLWLRNVHGDAARELFRLEPIVDGQPLAYLVEMTPGELRLRTDRGVLRLCIAGEDLVRVRGEGVGLRLTARQGSYNFAVPQAERRWLLNMATAFRNYLLHPLCGEAAVDAPWGIARCEHVIIELTPDAGGIMEAALEQGVGTWASHLELPSYAQAVEEAAAEFAAFLQPYLPVPEALQETSEAAAYLNWSSVVGRCGFFTRPAMLMSKNWMTNVWSWDHAFNAWATSLSSPELAWDQLLLMFDHQQPSGQLPDFINDVVRLYNFVKPPVHGWVYRRMMAEQPFFRQRERLAEFYPKLAAMTEWWFAFRNPDGDGLPQYHHGNDSGWDNGTVFDIGLPVKGADLAAFLVLQMDLLAEMAEELGNGVTAQNWRARADSLLDRLLSRCWTGDRFISPSTLSGQHTAASDSIFSCLPVVLGERLPAAMRPALVAQIRHYLTDWGLATEHPDSPLYEPDGYWRGPIWAPPTLIIADGLRAMGETALAQEIAERFCALCRTSGFAENFDAQTGAPLRDPAYTWTASVYLVLAHGLT